ncbi:unnamed protein product [Cunninghamella echinulata]
MKRLKLLRQRLLSNNINRVPNYTVVVQFLQNNQYGRSTDEVIDYILRRNWLESSTDYSNIKKLHRTELEYLFKRLYGKLDTWKTTAMKNWLIVNQNEGINVNDFRNFQNPPSFSLYNVLEKITIDLSKAENKQKKNLREKIMLNGKTNIVSY